MNTPHSHPMHELRVLDGEQRGACVPLQAGQPCSVSGTLGSDVVLRATTGADAAAQITVLADGLQVLAVGGEVQAGGAVLPVGSSVQVPWLQPVQVGGTRLAVGPVGDAGWAALFGTAPMPAPVTAVRALDTAPRWGRRVATAGAALAAASLSMLALAVAVSPRTPTTGDLAHRAQAMLHSNGFTDLSVVAGEGEIVVNGYLDSHAQRTRAEQLLAGEGLRARMSLWVNETVTRAVRDVYRVKGVQAEVQSTGPGRVQVRTTLANPAPLADIEKTVRRDVVGLKQLETQNDLPLATPSPVPAMDDPGKRVAAVVAADEPYVVTLDGTRYFVGALLPTGHRIVGIDGSRVRLEREGESTALVF